MHMKRRGVLEVVEKILKLLEKGEYSVHAISEKANCQWKTAIKCLEFLKRIKLVKERVGNKTYRSERLFSLK